jgi:hypothetical protein
MGRRRGSLSAKTGAMSVPLADMVMIGEGWSKIGLITTKEIRYAACVHMWVWVWVWVYVCGYCRSKIGLMNIKEIRYAVCLCVCMYVCMWMWILLVYDGIDRCEGDPVYCVCVCVYVDVDFC